MLVAAVLAAAGAVAAAPGAAASAGSAAGSSTVAAFCRGDEVLGTGAPRVRPRSIALECAAYGPQYGNPNRTWLTGMAWLSWRARVAVGYGMIAYTWCPDGGQLTGISPCASAVVRLPARVTLSQPARYGRSGLMRFTRVRVEVAGLPDQPAGLQALAFSPPAVAYR